jgi:hypothetical protein
VLADSQASGRIFSPLLTTTPHLFSPAAVQQHSFVACALELGQSSRNREVVLTVGRVDVLTVLQLALGKHSLVCTVCLEKSCMC